MSRPRLSKKASLLESLVREEHKKYSVFDKYAVVEELGKGSMGEVQVCTIKEDAVGGSAVSPAEKKNLFHLFRKGKSKKKKKNQKHEIEERRENPVCYALKSIRLDRFDDTMVKELQNEVAILKGLDHPNIVRAHEVYYEKRNVYLVLDCCVGGNLYSKAPYSEKAAAKISHDLLSAIKYMHDNGIVHRDLKFENIMFDSEDDDSLIKVIDFGLAKDLVHRSTATMYSTVGTIYTMAPQVITGKYNSKADLWSTGVIIFMLLSQKIPFYHKNRRKMIDQIFRPSYSVEGKGWENISEEAKDLVKHLLVVNEKVRYDADQALAHRWFKKMESGHLSEEEKMSEALNAASLVKYKQTSNLKRVALYLVAHRSTTKEIMETREIFKRYDKDSSGTLSYDEFRSALISLGYPEDLVKEAFECIDMNKTGEIMYTEFLAATMESRHHIEEERIAEAFDRIDKDDSGSIDRKELEQIMNDSCYSKEKLDEVFSQADLNQDGKISFEEFLAHFRKSAKVSGHDLFEDEDDGDEHLLGPHNSEIHLEQI